MNCFRKTFAVLTVAFSLLILFVFRDRAVAKGPLVSEIGNKHNLSSIGRTVGSTVITSNINLYQADPADARGKQICIFCHTPHSANVAEQAPLWNRAFSSVVTFQRYTSTTLRIRHITEAQYGDGAQPNGASKLCLSCHDGVSRLGAVYTGPEITMAAGRDVITGLASFNPSTNKMLTGHHPVSFVYMTGFNVTAQTGSIHSTLPASYRFVPLSSAGTVKLFDTDRKNNGWMQCTTCHNPHQNQSEDNGANACYNSVGTLGTCDAVPCSPCDPLTNFNRKVAPFWTYHGSGTTATQDTGTVCKVCHALGSSGGPKWP
ncbi:MAG: hypothetical protein HY888_00605 [Deltaproteobacteria bacterium]|nr:hypothetical protein [Deltaproteobacteria bacterium]